LFHRAEFRDGLLRQLAEIACLLQRGRGKFFLRAVQIYLGSDTKLSLLTGRSLVVAVVPAPI
jgi:hypothetical protein